MKLRLVVTLAWLIGDTAHVACMTQWMNRVTSGTQVGYIIVELNSD